MKIKVQRIEQGKFPDPGGRAAGCMLASEIMVGLGISGRYINQNEAFQNVVNAGYVDLKDAKGKPTCFVKNVVGIVNMFGGKVKARTRFNVDYDILETQQEGSKSFEEYRDKIESELNLGRPVHIRVTGTIDAPFEKDSGHSQVIYGVDNGLYLIHDPGGWNDSSLDPVTGQINKPNGEPHRGRSIYAFYVYTPK